VYSGFNTLGKPKIRSGKMDALERLMLAIEHPYEATQIFDRNMDVKEMEEALRMLEAEK
jgi:hypothetical protein